METIIGLGRAGCNIAEEFQRYSQYEVYLIDTEPSAHKNYFRIPEQKSHEAYEEFCPSPKDLFENINTSCLFILSGAGKISGASLQILSHLIKHKVSILYIHPNKEELQGETLLHHNAVFGVLQEYVRSGALERLYIIQNDKIEEMLEDLTVIGYYSKINNFLVSSLHMINVFSNTDSEFDTFRDLDPAARIATFGIVEPDSVEEKLFFDLKMSREKRYYFGINRAALETDVTILKKIKENLKKKLDGMTKMSYGIYSTSYESNYGYCMVCSSLIQTEGEKS